MICVSESTARDVHELWEVAPERIVVAPHGRPFSVMGFTVTGGKIVEIDALADPERLRELDLAGLDD